MKLSAESELMQNQKHATVMDHVRFEVLQSGSGSSLFFSIGSDGIFYVTREVSNSGKITSVTGWNRMDLSSKIAKANPGATVNAKMFALAQNNLTLAFDIVLVMTINGTDALFVSAGHRNDDSSWVDSEIVWTQVRTDAPLNLKVNDIMLMSAVNPTKPGTSILTCFVDIYKFPDQNTLLDRYYVRLDPATEYKWKKHPLPVTVSAGDITSCLGQRTIREKSGIYTFSQLLGKHSLYFTPQTNPFSPTVAPSSVEIPLPAGATAIASSLSVDKQNTNLFVTAPDGLYVYTPKNQEPKSKLVRAVNAVPLAKMVSFEGISELSASSDKEQTSVWALNKEKKLFYMSCTLGREEDPSSWTCPAIICENVVSFSFFLNQELSHNVLFAHLKTASGDTITQLSQDPTKRGPWAKRRILLPATDASHKHEFTSFTTHLKVMKDNGVGIPNAPVTLTSITPVSVYIDNMYYTLSNTATSVHADPTGTLTIIEEVESLAATVITANVEGFSLTINPMDKKIQKTSDIKDLKSVQIKKDGKMQNLVGADVSPQDADDAHKALQDLLGAHKDLPSDGSVKPKAPAPKSEESHVGIGDLFMHPGDFFHHIGTMIEDIGKAFLQVVDGVYHFVVHIGELVIRAVLDTISAVAGAIKNVFDKIKVFFEDLVAFLGFLFDWEDIKRTHKVIKNVLVRVAEHSVGKLGEAETTIGDYFDKMEKAMSAFTGVSSAQGSMAAPVGGVANDHPTPEGTDSPQSNWAMYHTKNFVSQPEDHPEPKATTFGDVFDTAITDLKTQVLDKADSLPPSTIAKTVVGIFLKGSVGIAKVTILDFIRLIKAATSGLISALTHSIEIPILSDLYKKFVGEDLSVLDVICLAAAIPATIVCKIATNGKAPCPDNSTTQALINAKSLDEIRNLVKPSRSVVKTRELNLGNSGEPKLFKTRELNLVSERAITTAATTATPTPPSTPPTKSDSGVENSITGLLNMVGMIGGVLVGITCFGKDADRFIPGVSEITGLAAFAALAPGFACLVFEKWEDHDEGSNARNYFVASSVLVGISVVKCLADIGGSEKYKAIADKVDVALNLAGLILGILVFTVDNNKLSDMFGFIGGLIAGGAGVGYLFIQKSGHLEIYLGLMVLSSMFVMLSGIETFQGK
ncbi:hypothetical protein BJ742DRAFT_856984 [Cladochytrium replicatum]|nr:hypothetical protein BJ742DRAFT_856984 [Cladochytrium replicatum]